jgi:hypothetical protein
VATEPADEYIGLVVRLQTAHDGTWYISVDGTQEARMIPLVPLTVVLRLRRVRQTGVLRGTIELQGTTLSAPIQTNRQLEELVRVWLYGEDNLGQTRINPS